MWERTKANDSQHLGRTPKSPGKSALLKKSHTQQDLRKDDSLKHVHYRCPQSIQPLERLNVTTSQKTLVHGITHLSPKNKAPRAIKGSSSKELLVDRPKINKKKNGSSTQLQQKLRSLEDKLQRLKANIAGSDTSIKRPDNKNKTKSKSKASKSNKSKSVKSRKSDSIDQLNRHPTPQPKSQPLSSYVTRMMPSKKIKSTKEQSKSPKSDEPVGYPYYVGNLINSLKKEETHPFREHLLQCITTVNYLKKLQHPLAQQIQHLKIKVKPPLKTQNTKTVVLDLDETLIHCNDTEEVSDFKIPITFPNGEVIQAGVNVRPYAKQLLRNLAQHFQVIVFTASHACYANVVLDCLDPENKLISMRVYRDNCFQTDQGMYIKDLRIFSNRDLAKTVLVDNAAHSYFFQMQNGIPILPFYFDKKDNQLRSLERFLLEQILPAEDVRPVIKQLFRLQEYCQYSDVGKLIQGLYLSK